ncbi:homer protein homolog 2-like [Mytilus edulis]|uniref:homer protein homolog 2-like n=1 Tax=Mytilus edulis TaxID=6550 RepID=UPI0039F06D24
MEESERIREQIEFDKKLTLTNEENRKLADKINECKQQEEIRNKEQEEKFEKRLHDLERKQTEQLQTQTKKAYEDQIAQLKKQMEESERIREQIEFDKKLTLANEENEKLADKIKKIEIEKEIAESGES